jgi:hypothetical protein
MTIAELIRQGCKIYPRQEKRGGFSFSEGGEAAACVRAAAHAAYAEGIDRSLTFDDQGVCEELYDSGHPLNVAFSSIKVPMSKAPDDLVSKMSSMFPISLLHAITELNDHFGWSREEIASWIEHSGLNATVENSNRSMVTVSL